MVLPYWIFLIVYGIALVFYIAFMLFNLYHMVRFGLFDFVGKVHAVLVFGVMGAILLSTALLLKDAPWGDNFSVLPSFDTNNALFTLP